MKTKKKKNLLLKKWAISITYYYLVFFNSFILEQSIVLTLYLQFKEKYSRKKTQLILLRDVYIFNKQKQKKTRKKKLRINIKLFSILESTSGTESKFVPMSCYCLLCYCSTVLLLSLLYLQNYSDQIT